jgi:hypothetical protein
VPRLVLVREGRLAPFELTEDGHVEAAFLEAVQRPVRCFCFVLLAKVARQLCQRLERHAIARGIPG